MTATDAPSKVLVVDDEEGIRTILGRLLRRLPDAPDCCVETAESAERALELLEERRYALILTDFNMGGKDGISLLATARERWPETARALMTGYTDESIVTQAREKGGAAAVFRKPWNNQELLSTLTELLEKPKPER